MHDLRDRNLAAKGESPKQAELSLQPSGPTFFSVCATLLYRRKKKEKRKLVKCRKADTTTTKKVLGVHSARTGMMPGPAIEIDICDLSRHAKLGREITLGDFCLFFNPRLPQEDGAYILVPYRGITGTDFDRKR